MDIEYQTGFWAGYTRQERRNFLLHTTIAVLCIPFYIMFPFRFGLLMAPYLFLMAIRPKSEYLLPIIIHMIYGSQQRVLFIFGCFIYVLIHCFELRRYSLHWLYALYMALLPYFVWYFWQKLHMPRFETGVGQYFGGLLAHFVFSVAFWGALAIKKTGRPFFRGMIILSFVLFLAMAVIGGSASLDRGTGEGEAHTVFSHLIFYAIPVLSASFTYLVASHKKGFGVEKCISFLGCILIITGLFHLHRHYLSFTGLGLATFASFLVLVALKWNRLTKSLSPIPLFLVSAFLVLNSEKYVERYGGLYKGEGEYNEMKIDSIKSFFRKMQRKAIDDRAVMWGLTVQYIRNNILPDPIWVAPVPYMEVDMRTDSGKSYVGYIGLASHNTMLNLIRLYGFYGGLGLYLLFVWFACRKENRLFLAQRAHNGTIIIMATSIAEAVIGGHTGHYPVGPAVGTVIFVCFGACWGEMREMRRRML